MNENMPVTKIQEFVSSIENAIGENVYGQRSIIRLLTLSYIAGGHVLLEGPPGVAKTLLARSFATALGLSFKRLQFTPDLMPSDVTGVSVFEPARGEFRFAPGPIFGDVVLADEINRTPPKTQAALLEAMEEHHVTVDGVPHDLGELFFVVATQNPIEHEGTFPLPEAQLDRFFAKLTMTYPDKVSEASMIERMSRGEALPQMGKPLFASGGGYEILRGIRNAVRTVTCSPSIASYIVDIARASREHHALSLGVSPRAALNVALAAKANAAFEGREYVIPDDIQHIAMPVLAHRLIFKPEVFDAARDSSAVVKEILSSVPVPRE